MRLPWDRKLLGKKMMNINYNIYRQKNFRYILFPFIVVIIHFNIMSSAYAEQTGISNVTTVNTAFSEDMYLPAQGDELLPELPVSDGLPVRELEEGLPVEEDDTLDEGENDSFKAISVTYDIKTGKEIIHNNDMNEAEDLNKTLQFFKTNGGQGEETDAPDDTDQEKQLNFSGLSLVPNSYLTSSPYRKAVKIKSFKTDTNGGHLLSSCSGTLIDSTHVIAAGHCIYSHTSDSVTFNDWNEAVIVVPAYRETSGSSNPWTGAYWDTSG
ncbi:MAG: hypothetical protein D3923_02585, partial [Candidatus Electrothrix sp. AR3]|nr:hypothetical protein [Candidatus Electrothrix sp. AR3]